ncbi:MAG: hypothetical protein IJ658_11290 [Kiritimatiellae bacterium]|nr:hypothetical protein [Kiritimatiellia bacterium]
MKRMIIFSAVGILLAGCDFEWPSQRKAKEEAIRKQAVRQEQRETEREQARGECEALRQFVAARFQMLKAGEGAIGKELEELKSDRRKMSARLDELSEKSMADKNGTRESALFAVLKDEAINELAFKYLGNDFVTVRSEFAEKVRRALKQEQQKKAALDRNRAEYDKAVGDRRERARQSQQESAAAAERLKREIAETDQRLQKLRRRMTSISKQERERAEREISLAEQHLYSLKSQFTAMRLSREQAVQARDADYDFDAARKQAIRERQEADAEVLLRTKDDVTAFELAEAYETLTVKKLDGVIFENLLAVRARSSLLAEQMLFLSSVTNGIERLDLAGVRRVREDVEREIARKPGEGKKAGNARGK